MHRSERNQNFSGEFGTHIPFAIKARYSELNKLAESVVKEDMWSFPLIDELILCFKEAWSAQLTRIIRRLSPKMSKVHPWMVCFDLSMPYEDFADLLKEEILGLTRFGI